MKARPIAYSPAVIRLLQPLQCDVLYNLAALSLSLWHAKKSMALCHAATLWLHCWVDEIYPVKSPTLTLPTGFVVIHCRMMYLLLKSKRSKDSYESQKILLKKIKSVIESSRPKFSGYRQQVICIYPVTCMYNKNRPALKQWEANHYPFVCTERVLRWW